MLSNVSKHRSAVIVACGVFFLGALFYHRIQSISFQREQVSNEFAVRTALKGSALETFVREYSVWDDMARFSLSGNRGWARETIDPSLAPLSADAVWVYGADSSRVYSVSSSGQDDLRELPLPGSAMKDIFKNQKICRFFMNTPQGLMEIHGASVHPTDDTERASSPRGYLFAGRFWTGTYVNELGAVTGSTINMLPVSGAPAPDGTFISMLKGWDGKPVMRLAVRPKAMPASGTSPLPMAAAMAVIAAVAILLYASAKYNAALQGVAASFAAGDSNLLKPLGKNDILPVIARQIEQFVEDRAQWEKENRELRQALDKNAVLRDELENKLAQPPAPAAPAPELAELQRLNEALTEDLAALRRTYQDLEAQFQKRTEELYTANELLQNETTRENKRQKAELVKAIYEKKLFEKALARAHAELEEKTTRLAAANESLQRSGSGLPEGTDVPAHRNLEYTRV